MQKRHLTAGMVALVGLLLAAPSWGQMAPPPKPVRGYDLSTVETLIGTVVDVKRVSPKKAGGLARVQLQLKTDQGMVLVHLGPADYVGQQGMNLAPGDQIQVKGSRISGPRRNFMVAAQVRKGEQVLQLRDETGRPLWSRGRIGPY